MLYHVTRNGVNYGPYTQEDLQRYVASGNVLPTDMAKSDDMAEWVPVSQILGTSALPPSPAADAPPAYMAGVAPVYAPTTMPYPDPPNLHWGLVLVIGIFTCGLFCIVWDFVQSAWMRKVNPRSNALFLYIAAFVINFVGTAGRMVLIFSGAMHHNIHPHRGLAGIVFIISFTLLELARFDMRRSMEEHFNGPEPIGLSLSAVMTFFFGTFYFQYHFTRINELKQMARYRGAAI
jgi:hypothetical protein